MVFYKRKGIVFYILLFRGAAVVIGSLIYIRIRHQQELRGRVSGDFLEHPIEGADIVEAAGQGHVRDLFTGVPKL